MARSARSAAMERAFLQFAPPPWGGVASGDGLGEEFDESDIWGAFSAAPAEPRPARPVPAARKAAPVGGRAAAHGSLPVNIPDWSKILGDEEDVGYAGTTELAWRRRAASLSVHEAAGCVGRTLKVRDAVWKRTTGFQD